jgi:hypothetical protein
LVELRADGFTFDEAWRMTMRLIPPRGHDLGGPRCLFDEQGQPTQTQTEFFRKVCENAFHRVSDAPGSGNGPALQFFRPEMLRDLDFSTPAPHARGKSRGLAA